MELIKKLRLYRDIWHKTENEAADEIELLRNLVRDIKAWDVGQCMTIPHELRARMEAALPHNVGGNSAGACASPTEPKAE